MKKIAIIDSQKNIHNWDLILGNCYEVEIVNDYENIKYPNSFDAIFVEFIGLNAINASKRKHKNLIIRTQGVEIFESDMNLVNWKNVKHLLFLQQHQMDYFKQNFEKCNPQHMGILPMCIYDGKFKNCRNKSNRNTAVAVIANITGRKGLVEIPKLLKMYPDLHVYHIGKICAYGGPVMDYIKWHIKRDGNENRYHYKKIIPHENIDSFLSNKTYVWSSSISEGFGRGILEGMSKGLKPIVHNYPGAIDIWGEEYVYMNLCEISSMLKDYEPNKYHNFVIENYGTKKALEIFKTIID